MSENEEHDLPVRLQYVMGRIARAADIGDDAELRSRLEAVTLGT